MAKFFVIKIESLITTFTISDAGKPISFVWNLAIPEGVSSGDSILGYLIDPINEFRLLFTVQSVQDSSLTLIKELETSTGVGPSQVDENLATRLSSHSCELFEVPEATYNGILNNLTSKFIPEDGEVEEYTGEYADYIKLLKTNHNLILTGAPGTGKTWLARDIAKKMNAVSEFVQFHPSFDYTDFVEGLRPILNNDTHNYNNSSVAFERRDGIFKRFCKTALQYSRQIPEEETDEVHDGSFEDLMSSIKRDIVSDVLTSYSPTGKLSVSDNDRIRYIRSHTSKTILDANVKLLYQYFVDKGQYDIEDETKESLQNYIRELTEAQGGKVTRTLDFTEYKWTLKELLKRKKAFEEGTLVRSNRPINKPFVFIIDEINRGDLSKIFFFFFFAIDKGYRGEKGRVTTQYQELITDNDDVFKDGFFIPKNVYIIGTMNDIDRSVESMDFAIRRRFAWKEVTAAMSAVNMRLGKEAKERMDVLNQAILDAGLTSAYQIGASYFLHLRNDRFEELWDNHLKGLIEEYLRGDPDAEDKFKKIKIAYNSVSE